MSVSRGGTAGAVASGAAAATSRVWLREGGDKVGESSHFCFQLLHLRVVGDSSDDWWVGDFYYFVSHVCQLAKIGSTVGGGKDHPHVGWERLEKELLEESVLFRRVTRWSPSSCCIHRSSCVGFLSPSSSPLMSCCSFHCFHFSRTA